MGLDITNDERLTSIAGEEMFPPSPVIWAVTSHGTLVAWTALHKKAKADKDEGGAAAPTQACASALLPCGGAAAPTQACASALLPCGGAAARTQACASALLPCVLWAASLHCLLPLGPTGYGCHRRSLTPLSPGPGSDWLWMPPLGLTPLSPAPGSVTCPTVAAV